MIVALRTYEIAANSAAGDSTSIAAEIAMLLINLSKTVTNWMRLQLNTVFKR